VADQIASFLSTVPDGSTIQFQPGGCYGQDGTILLANRNNLTINGEGSTFEALASMAGNSFWAVQGGTNITFTNMTIQGDNPYAEVLQGSPGCYNAGWEWQYGFAFDGTDGGTVNGVTINDIYGDFVEAEDDNRNTYSAPATNILIENNTFSGAGRMGIGITDGNGVTIEHNSFNWVCWEMVDIETDTPYEYGENVNIIDNTLGYNNFGLVANYGEASPATSGNVVVTGNTMTEVPATTETPLQLGGVGLGTSPQARSGCTVTGNYVISGGGTGIILNYVNNVTMENNTVAYGDEQGGSATGFSLAAVNTAVIENNDFPSLVTPYNASGFDFPGGLDSIDDLSTDITLVGNTLP
jgi:hypothetical protein